MKTRIILSLFICFSLLGCPESDYPIDSTLTIQNNSEIDLFYDYGIVYPDTMFRPTSNPFREDYARKASFIPANSTIHQPGSWRIEFKNMKPPGILSFFLFNVKIVDSVPWDTIRKYYLIEKRYEYNLQQMDSINWTIIFPSRNKVS